jgi:hypothetical protein
LCNIALRQNFKPIRRCYIFFFKLLNTKLAQLLQFCLRFATICTLVIPSSNIYRIKSIVALSKLAPFSNFTFKFLMPKSSYEWCELSLKSHFSNLWLVYYAQMLSFFFWCHINNSSQVGRMSIALCYPTFNKPIHQFIVCYLHNPIQIFQYKISICFIASRGRSGLMVLKALTLHQKDGYMNTSMTTIYYLYIIYSIDFCI